MPLRRGCEITQAAKDLQNGMGKGFRYAMSHETGKIEILGTIPDGRMLFKYHQVRDDRDAGRIFAAEVGENQCWLPDGPQPEWK